METNNANPVSFPHRADGPVTRCAVSMRCGGYLSWEHKESSQMMMNELQTAETPVVAKEILEALRKLDERKSHLLDLQSSVEVAREARARFPDIGLSPPMVDAFKKDGWSDVQMFAVVATVTDLQPLLNFLAQNGHRQSDKPRDIPEVQMRAWFCGSIMLIIMLGATKTSDDGKRCRYVEVGKKEVPIYELKCE